MIIAAKADSEESPILVTFIQDDLSRFPILKKIQDRADQRREDTGLKARDDALTAGEDAILNGDVFADNGSGADSENSIGDLEVASVNGAFADVGQTITLDSGALLTVNADGTFSYDPNGAFDSLLEGETATETFTYQARSTSSPFALDEATVTITVSGANAAPVFTSAAAASVAENETDTGYTAAAADDPGEVIGFSITGGADAALFSIDADTGELTFNAAADFETPGDDDGDNAYELVITATDDGGLSDSQAVTVNVTNADEAPVITSGGSASLTENQTDTDYTATAQLDADDDISFSISGGSDAALFSIDADTGELTFIAAPDFENPGDDDGDNAFEVEITATDGGGLTDIQAVTVTVTDANDAPVITSGGTASLAENETDTGYIAASTDQDAGDTVTFSITGGADAALFSIDADTGELTFNAAPDFENPDDDDGDNAYEIEISATDDDGLSDMQAVTVAVTDNIPAASLDLADLDGGNGFRLDGVDAGDYSGSSVSGAGDVNGDGIDDLIIGARRADPGGNSSAGESYVVFGSDSGFSASFDLAALDGDNGFRLNGVDAFDYSGSSVSGAGDVNGDGIDDLIIGAGRGDPDGNDYAGESYVVFGSDSGFAASLDLSALDGNNGFRLDGVDAGDFSGISISGAGDINGDGIDDLIIGANVAAPDGNSEAGESYVVFGSDSGFAASLDLSALDGNNGFRLDGVDAEDRSGSVSGAGDINGDGIDDLIIGARLADPDGNTSAGESYVVFGSDSGFAASLDLSALDGNNGFRLDGVDAGDQSGGSVSGAGDINGDGIDDLIIGASSADPDGNADAGESYVVFGSDSGFAASLDLSALDGSNGFRLDGVDADDASGSEVSGAGDINGDGIDDLIISAPSADSDGVPGTGESYIVFGSDSGFAASLDLSALDGTDGFRLDGVDVFSLSGSSISGAGDINGDGIDDLIVGASRAGPDRSYAGESYVVYGSEDFGPQSMAAAAAQASKGGDAAPDDFAAATDAPESPAGGNAASPAAPAPPDGVPADTGADWLHGAHGAGDMDIWLV